MKKVYEASTPGFSRVMSNVASLFSSRTMSALPAVATLLCLSFVGVNVAHSQCQGVSCAIGYAPVPVVPPAPPLPAGQIIVCLNNQGEAQINATLMGPYTTTSNSCCSIVRVWEDAAATNPLTPADPDFDVDCTDIGRTIQVWVTRETNVPPIQGGPGRSAPLPFTILIADCTPPNITCPAPQTLLCLSDYTGNLPPNPMTYAEFNALGGGALVTDNAQACVPTGYEVSYTDAFSNLICLNGFTVTRTFIATDASGNTKSCTQVITVSDNQPPFFTTTPQDLTLNCPSTAGQTLAVIADIQAWLNNYGGASVDDSCPGGFTQSVAVCLLGQGFIGCQTTSPATGLGVWAQMPEACSPQPREVQVGFFVTDACGNEAFAVAKVILIDDVPPTVNPAQALFNTVTVTCLNLVPAPNPQAIIATDNCTTPPAQLIRKWEGDSDPGPASATCGNRQIIRTYSVTDCAGNSQTRTQIINVTDNVNPVWGPNPSGQFLACENPNNAATLDAWLANNGGGNATDNCNGVTITANYASGADILAAIPAWCPGNTPTRSVTVTFTATDGCGNTTTRTAVVTLSDFTAPNADAIPTARTQCNPSDVPAATLTGITDNCTPSASVTVTPQPDQLVSAGNGCANSPRVYVRNYRLTDCAGNTRDIPQMIIVADTIAPTWTTDPSALNLSCPGSDTDIQNWLNNRGGGSATDNCGTVNYRTIPATLAEIRALLGDCAPLAGSVTVTFVAEDNCLNSSTRTAVLTITDNVNPSAGNPTTINLKCVSQIPDPNPGVVPGVSDACSPAGTITVKFERDSTSGNLPGCPGDVYQFFHIYSITDCSGNGIERVQRFNIADDIDPNANCKSITVYLDENGSVEVCAQQFDDNSADNCGGTLTYEFARDIINDGINFAFGPYTDCKEFTCADIANIANCAANPNTAGQIAVRMRVIDACGNVSGFCTTNLTVVDSIKPTIECEEDREVFLSEEGDYDCQTAVEIEHPLPFDNCSVQCYEMEVLKEIDGQFVTIDPATGAPAPNFRVDILALFAGEQFASTYTFEKGPYCGINADDEERRDDEYIIRYYIRDEHGNNNQCEYKITIKDDLAPVFTFCPDQPIIEAQSTAGDCYQMKCWEPPTWYDNCQFPFFGEGSGYCPIPELVVTTSDPSVMVDLIGDDHCALFPVGQTEVYYTVTDFCGNSNTCTVTVIISDVEAPMAMCVGNYSVNLQPNGLLELTFADIDAGSSDNCGLCSKEIGRTYLPGAPVFFGPTVMLTCDDVANSPIEITLRVKDCGQPLQNEAECTVLVTVLDMQLPGIATCPADIIQCTDAGVCNAEVVYNIPTFNDGCNSQHDGTLQVGLASGSTFPIGTTLVAYDYTSVSGYNVVCQFNVTIEDCEAPNMVCPPNVQMTCLEALCCPEDFTGGTLTDNCGVTLLQSSDFDNDLTHCPYDGVRIVVRTYTAWDAAGNSSTCQRTYTWTEDTNAPIFDTATLPTDETVACAADVPAVANVVVTDDCGTVNVDFSEVVENAVCVNQQVIVRTWVATDLCGNQSTFTHTITVNDTEAPTFGTSGPFDFESDCSEDVPAVVAPTVGDNCEVFTVDFSETVAPGGCEDRFVVTRTWVATDICGNASTYVQVITINDNLAPSITDVPAGETVQCSQDIPAVVHPTITDNCVQVNVDFSETVTPGGCEDNFTVVRRWVATDQCGNATVAFQIINVNDNTKPVLSNLPDEREVVECAALVPTVAAVTASDNCGDPLNLDFSEVEVPGACVNQYSIVRTWTATDACGNSTSFQQTIVVSDTEAPTFSNTPVNYASDCSEDVPAVVAPTVNDNCGVFTVDFSEVVAPGGCEDQFVVTRTWVATDICGNANTYVQTITIEDKEAPVFTNVPANEVVECAEQVPAVVHPDVSDNCSQVVVDFSENIQSNGCLDKFTVTRTWVATDACGNQAVTFQIITVNDAIAPVLGNLPDATVAVSCAQEVPAVAAVTASDNCGEPLTLDFSEVELPGTCHDQYQIMRTWTAQDACGNRTSFTQLITINDNVAPVLYNLPTATVDVECAEEVPAMPNPAVYAEDNCGAPIVLQFYEVEIPGTCHNQYSIQRVWSAQDNCGNSTFFVQTINVNDNEAPELHNLPENVTVTCASDVPAVPEGDDAVYATDNCGAPIVLDFSEVEIPGTCVNRYQITRTWIAQDDCGNSTSYVQTITIFDDIAPELEVKPVDRRYACVEEVETAPIQRAEDNCGVVTIDFSEFTNPGACQNQVVINRRWVAYDLCGNSSEWWQEIIVHDDVAPTFLVTPVDRTYECLEDVPPAPDQHADMAEDNCGIVFVDFLETRDNDYCQNQVIIIRRWEATDLCGNKNTHWQYITVYDDEAPILLVTPTDRTYECLEDVHPAPDQTPFATDNCGVFSVDFFETRGDDSCQNQVLIIRRWEATDLCGNKATHWQYITVQDDVAPVFRTTPSDRSYECVEDVETAPINIAEDNCDIVFVDFAEFTNPGGCPSQVVINRRWVATDLCGNTAEHWQVITVNDDKAPVLSSTPFDLAVDCSEKVPAAPVITATDNCDDVIVEFSETTTPGGCLNQYVVTRHWQAIDLCGNSVEWYQTITVNDDVAPTWTSALPADVTVQCGEDVQPATLTASDNCVAPLVEEFNETLLPGAGPNDGAILTRTWTVTDACGNSIQHTQTVTINDTEAPVLGNLPAATVSVVCAEDVPAVAAVTYTDNCQGTVDFDFNETILQGDCDHRFTLTRTWTATDFAGNSTQFVQTISVNDNVAPTWTSALPADVTVQCGEDVQPASLTASDNCAGQVLIEMNESLLPGAGPNDGAILTRTWTAYDVCGNYIQHTQTVTIIDTQAPVLGNLPAAAVNVECSEDVPAVAAVTFTDNCQGTVDFDFTEVAVPGVCFNQYQIIRTWTATDFAGNSTQFVQTITVSDTQAPVWDLSAPLVWINEFHYDNVGTDVGEFIEVAGTAGTDLSNYQLVLYNGATANAGVVYNVRQLSGTIPNQSNGFGTVSFAYPTDGIQNGPRDGIALVFGGTQVLQFLSYEGSLIAIDGPASGMTSTSIGVEEGSATPIGFSLNLIGTGNKYEDFAWSGPSDATPGTLNIGQTMTAAGGFALPGNLDLECAENVPMPAVLSATDNCGAPIDLEYTEVFLPGAGPNDGVTIIRTWTAEDVCGNSIVHTQTITINDTEAPVLGNLPPATVNVVCAEDVPAIADVTFTDNCAGTVNFDFSETILPGDCAHRFTLTRTWTATDFAGNSTQFVQTINVNDNVAPTWTSALPANVTVQCGEDVQPASLTASDNCAGAVVVDFSETLLPGAGPNDGAILTRTWTAYDVCGNSIQYVQTVTINDTQAPVLGNLPPAVVNVSCAFDVPAIANVTYTDNCQGTVDFDFNETILPGNCVNRFTLTRTWTATDFAGNSTQFVQTINVNDNIAPTWTSALPANVTIECGENVQPATLTATDNCLGNVLIEMNETLLPGAGPNDGPVLTRTWTAYDECGNSIQHIQTITINDTQAPVLGNLPAATVNVTCASDVPAIANVTYTDNCQGTVDFDFNETIVPGDCSNRFTLTRTWTATDFAGNSTQFVQTINVNDNVAPVWTSALPANVTVQCGEDVQPATLTASDNCGGAVVIDTNETLQPGAGPNDGVILTRIWTAYDECGNTIQHVQTVTILDNVAPTLGNLPVANLTVECSDQIPAVANVTASDNCQGTVNFDFTESILLGNCINQYTLTRTWTATDFAGNSTQFVQTITVNDTQAPTWNQPAPANATVDCAAAVPAAPTQTATDNCGVPVITDFSEIIQPGSCLNKFTIVRTWSVQDDCGNATSRQQIITVDDNIAPVMACPAPLQAQCSPSEQPPYANLTEFQSAGGTATDNCGLNVNSFGLLSETAVGNVYTRTYRVIDQCGNAGTCTQTVTVLDTQAPVFLNCPTGPLTFGNDPDQCSAKINWPQPVAVDNCSIPVVVQTAGPTAGSVVPVGNYTVTFRATDARGNSAFCTFQVMVMDTEKPEFDADIVMPGDVTVECDAVPAPFVLTNNDVNDNCTAPAQLVITFTEVRTNGNCAFNYVLTRTWRVTDQAGNQLVHTQIVTVRDTKAPTAICRNVTVTLDKNGNATITAAQVNNGSFDNCSSQANLTFSVTPNQFTCANLGANTVTLTVTDQCGNSATCTATVTVLEGIGPCTPQYTVTTSCLNNATTMDNGQFVDLITVKSLAMQTWTIISNTGLFLTSSPAPPAAPVPVPVGTAFTMGNLDGIDNNGNGQVDEADEMVFYTLRGVHVEAIGYSITIRNNLGQTATISNKGYYPTPIFLNLEGPYCLNTPPFVIQVGEQYGAQGTVTNIMVNGVNTNTFNAANLGLGFHTVMATFDAGGATTNLIINGQQVGGSNAQALADPGCQQKITKIVQVVSTPTTIVCNDLVHVSISNDGANCVFTLSPDNVLEGSYLCDDDYRVVITYPAGTTTFNPANRVDNTHIGKTLNYSLVHNLSGNVCWGKIKVEDKEAPKLTCPANITISCSNPTTPSFTGQVLISDCSPTTSVVTDDLTDFGACADPRGQIVRLWLVTDAWGNQSSCTQTITIDAFDLADVIFPADVTVNCATAGSLEPNVTGSPSINGTPIGQGGMCMASISRTDDRYDICPGSYEIVRTWRIRNMCLPLGQGNPREHQQVIKVIDNQGPVLDCPANITVSTDPFNCCATAPLPSVLITETCSQVTSLEYRVVGTDFATGNLVIHEGTGFLSDFPGNNYWNPDTLGNFGFTQCLPRGEYTVTYRATDACGNMSACTFRMVVEDQIPPVAVCDEFTQVAVGADGMAFVNATTFDDGSYDVCESVTFKARRMNANDCQSNEFFYDQVKFCCSDIGDTIMVVFRVYDVPVPAGNVGLEDYDGHYNDCMVRVFVEDKIRPLCNAPANASVSCENFDPTLWAYGFATGFDNCCLDTITETRNLALFDTVCNRGTITRTFRVFDCGGNSTTCTQRVFVSYNQNYFVRFPDDRIITVCDGTGNFGEPTFFGEDCELLGVSFADEVYTVVPDACYMIERTWTIINWCTYNPNAGCINVPNPNPNVNSQSPQNLPGPIVSPAGTPAPWAPTVVSITPGATPTNYSTFWSANANCYIYKQTIKVIDTQKPIVQNCPSSPQEVCDITQNDANLWNAMYWWDNTIGSHDLCEGPTDLTITATDLCSGAAVNMRYLLFLDLDGDGTMETVISSTNLPGFNNVNFGNAGNQNYTGGTPRQFDFRPVPNNQKYGFALQTTISGNNKTASVRWNTQQSPNTYVVPELPYGTHKIKWIVDDGCGNEESCEYVFEVKDCKKPTVVCLNGLSVNIMPTKMITLNAGDFLQYTNDNCTPDNQLVIAIRKAGQGTGFPLLPNGQPQTSVTFTCAELGQQNVEIWSRDKAGNADFCVTYVLVQDNMNNCSSTAATVAGALKTETGSGLEDANVELDGTSPTNPSVNQLVSTNADGDFVFVNVPLNGDYTLTPIKDNDPLNGVSTFDLVLINKHILGIEPLNSPYKMIAADANNSRSITTFDIVELRKLILGIYTELPNNTSWRFVDSDFNFPNQQNPFQTLFPETKQLANLQGSTLAENFVAVKVGDVNGNAVTNSLTSINDRTDGTLLFDVAERSVKAGETFTVNFRANERTLGYQFTLYFPNLEVVDVTPIAGEMSLGNFGIFNSEHSLTTSFDNERVNGEFAITFRAKASGALSEMLSVSGRITKAEAYSLDRERQSVALRFNSANGSTVAGLGFELYQNQPNPWMNKTQVGFHLPEAAEATLTIFDESGRLVFTQKGSFNKGYNAISIDRAVVSTTGMLYYKLETATDSAVKKMIQTK